MHIISRKALQDFYNAPGNESSKVALEMWRKHVEKAEWRNLADIKKDYPSADYVGNDWYVFNIHGNSFRLVVVVIFVSHKVLIRWVGRHKDYDKIDCTTI